MSDENLHSLPSRTGQARLRIISTTDLHGHIFPYDYFADRPSLAPNLANAAIEIENARSEVHNNILVDCGDFLQGTPLADLEYETRLPVRSENNPVIAAMNKVGYDAATLGNHDFNFGLNFLYHAAKEANYPFVISNVEMKSGNDSAPFTPYLMLDRTIVSDNGATFPLKIGIVGFTPPQITTWDHLHLAEKAQSSDIVEAAERTVSILKESGADLVIALSHSGIDPNSTEKFAENATVGLAEVDGIDAIIAGHSHKVFPSNQFISCDAIDVEAGALHGKPAVMAGFRGSHLGIIDLQLEFSDGKCAVVRHAVQARPVARRMDMKTGVGDEVLRAASEGHRKTLKHLRRKIGSTRKPLHSFFAMVANDGCVQLVARAQKDFVKAKLAGTEYAELPLLSAASSYRFGGQAGPGNFTDIPEGALTIRNIAELCPFPNNISAVVITGKDLRGWLERAASVFGQLVPGESNQPLLNTAFPSYTFDTILGITYRLNLSRPAQFSSDGIQVHSGQGRVESFCWQGRPINDDAQFVVASNSFRASGGGAFPGASRENLIFQSERSNRSVLETFVTAQKYLEGRIEPIWSFSPLPGTSALFDSSPGGQKFAAAVKDRKIEFMSTHENGFARYQLEL